MTSAKDRSGTHLWQDKANLALGALLFASPWILGFADSVAGWNAWILGGIFVAGTAALLSGLPTWIAWFVAFGGFWNVLSPRILKFTADESAMALHMAVGALVAVFAVWGAIVRAQARQYADPALRQSGAAGC